MPLAQGFHIDKREFEAFLGEWRGWEQSLQRGLVSEAQLPEMRAAFERIGRHGQFNVRQHVPIYMGQNSEASKPRRAGAGHLPPGSLFNAIDYKATASNVTMVAKWDGPLLLQEFGGKSWWSRGFAGGWKRGGRSGRSRSVGSFEARSANYSKHLIYEKPRRARGYFIWNWTYHIWDYIGTQIAEGMRDTAARYGISFEVAVNGGLNGRLEAEPFKRAA